MRLFFTVPGTPRGKQRHRTARVGDKVRSYTPKQTREYEAYVGWCYKAAFPEVRPTAGAVRLVLTIYQAIPKSWKTADKQEALAGLKPCMVKPDASNVLKAVEDGLNRIAYWDDKQIVSVSASKLYGVEPRVEIEVWRE